MNCRKVQTEELNFCAIPRDKKLKKLQFYLAEKYIRYHMKFICTEYFDASKTAKKKDPVTLLKIS